MGAVPKSRVGPARRRRRRTHYKSPAIHLVECPTCHGWHRPHHVCANCGSYRGVEVVVIEEEEST
jgi:large subunit ribosomal protein L32